MGRASSGGTIVRETKVPSDPEDLACLEADDLADRPQD